VPKLRSRRGQAPTPDGPPGHTDAEVIAGSLDDPERLSDQALLDIAVVNKPGQLP
jgi:hypothetical protein